MSEPAIHLEHVSKEYRLGAIGGGTLRGDLQSWWAKVRHREDPNQKIGTSQQAPVSGNERFLALDDISFEVQPGETVGIIGHNGAGKSTLLKLLSRVTAPTKGRIVLNGRIASMLEVGTGFHPELTGRENVYMNGAILGMTKAEITRKFDEIVEFAELSRFIDTPVKRYSSGMYVKLAFAVAAHLDSEILVMDEVLAVGDMKFQDKCLGKMGDVSSREGRTVLYVSHNMSTVQRLCQRCLVLDHGHMIFDGNTPSAIDMYMDRGAKRELKHIFKPAPYWDYYIRSIQMISCELLNTKDATYKQGEEVIAELTCHSDIDADNIRIRAEIFNRLDKLLGISCSNVLTSFHKGKEKVLTLKIQTQMLSAGEYEIYLALYVSGSNGSSTTIDLGRKAIAFEVIESNNENKIIFDPRQKGFVRFSTLDVE